MPKGKPREPKPKSKRERHPIAGPKGHKKRGRPGRNRSNKMKFAKLEAQVHDA